MPFIFISVYASAARCVLGCVVCARRCVYAEHTYREILNAMNCVLFSRWYFLSRSECAGVHISMRCIALDHCCNVH